MLLNESRLTYLFSKYVNDNASGDEVEELFSYIRKAEQQDPLKEQIIEVFQQIKAREDLDFVNWDKMFDEIVHRQEVKIKESQMQAKRFHLWKSVAAAVLVLILGGTCVYLYSRQESPAPAIVQQQPVKKDILPGGNKAILTLSNGTKVILDSANNGRLARQGNANVIKMGNGALAYHKKIMANGQWSINSKKFNVSYNTLTTPRGGQYQLTLSDGTKVWLNAASSIRYPTVFTSKKRKVEITGEAYFEIVHNEKKPFIVKVGNRVVEDLGTHFNINAYANEPAMKTTLLEGSIRVGNTILQPREQAILKKNGQIVVVKHVNVDDVIAWKNGFFAFNDANLKTVMRKLSRWYDVTVVYRQGVNNEQQFSGKIDRSLTLSQVLNGLIKQTRAHFSIETNRKLVIFP